MNEKIEIIHEIFIFGIIPFAFGLLWGEFLTNSNRIDTLEKQQANVLQKLNLLQDYDANDNDLYNILAKEPKEE